jgi:hypothetical protein
MSGRPLGRRENRDPFLAGVSDEPVPAQETECSDLGMFALSQSDSQSWIEGFLAGVEVFH